MDQGFYDTLVTLAKIGAAGVGIAIFLMVFIMIIRGQPVDAPTAKLRQSFLILGVAFAVVVGLFTIVPPLLQKPGGPVPLLLTYSPDMEQDGLPLPKAVLPDGKIVDAGQQFTLPPSTETEQVVIRVDKTLEQLRNLKQASTQLAQTVQTITQQRDALANEVAPASAAPAAQQSLQAQSQQTAQLQTQIVKSVQSGDFAHANVLSSQLHTSVINVKPSIAAIARAHP